MPAFDDAYGARPGSAITPRTDPRLTTRPQPRVTIRGPNARAHRNGPLRLVSMTASQSASRQLLHRTADVDAGVVDQDVDRAEFRLDLGRQPLDVRELVTSAANPRARRPVAAVIPSAASRHASTDRPDERDVGARLRQRGRHRASEPARAAGDERNLSVEPETLEIRSL